MNQEELQISQQVLNAEEIIEDIFDKRIVHDYYGNSYSLNSNIDKEEGEFLKEIIKTYKFKNTIEIGCAYGLSSLHICSAIADQNNCYHTIIDPFQSTDWKNIGQNNLEKAGINFFKILEEPSEIALPFLLSQNKKYDFGFIDGWHTFDHTLIDFFYLNRLIKVGGVIVIDDVGLPSINKFMRYILNYPSYELIGNIEIEVSKKRTLFNTIVKAPFRLFSRLLPPKIKNEIFSGKVIKSDRKLHLKSSMIALKKIKEDERPWNWYKEF